MIDLTEFESRAVPLRALGVVVSQNGTQLARKLWDDTCRRNVYSASKSFTSMAVGIAQKEGLLSIDEKLTDAFKDDLPEIVSDNLKAATVRDLLTMCLGQEKSFLMGGERPYYEDRNWVRLALRQPFVYAPGEKFVYNNVGPYLAGILVQRRAGCDLVHYLMPRMFTPMGIQLPTWENDPNGQTFGAGGLFLTIDELHLGTIPAAAMCIPQAKALLLWQSALRKKRACSPSTKSSRTHSRMTCPKSFPTT